jgi:hypothetical protein
VEPGMDDPIMRVVIGKNTSASRKPDAPAISGGRTVDDSGPASRSIPAGCLLLAAGLALTDGCLSSAPGLRAADRDARARRCRHRHHRGADHLGGAVRGAAGTVLHGGLSGQHQPGDRRRHRRGHPRRAGHLPAPLRPDRAVAALGHPGHFQTVVINALEPGRSRRTPPPTLGSARSSRKSSSALRTLPSTTGCAPHCTCPPGCRSLRVCLPSSPCAHTRPPRRSQTPATPSSREQGTSLESRPLPRPAVFATGRPWDAVTGADVGFCLDTCLVRPVTRA